MRTCPDCGSTLYINMRYVGYPIHLERIYQCPSCNTNWKGKGTDSGSNGLEQVSEDK